MNQQCEQTEVGRTFKAVLLTHIYYLLISFLSVRFTAETMISALRMIFDHGKFKLFLYISKRPRWLILLINFSVYERLPRLVLYNYDDFRVREEHSRTGESDVLIGFL